MALSHMEGYPVRYLIAAVVGVVVACMTWSAVDPETIHEEPAAAFAAAVAGFVAVGVALVVLWLIGRLRDVRGL